MDVPVLIVGAGPTGLTLATALHRHGIQFRIIDKQIKPVLTSNALVAQTRTLEVWDDMKLLAHALEQGNVLQAMNMYTNEKKIVHANFNEINSVFPFVLGIAQRRTETILQENLIANQIQIEMKVELVKFKEENEMIVAVLRHQNGEEEIIRVQWLAACDGIHSTVRSQLHLPFPGKELSQHFIVADVKVASTELALHEVHLFLSAEGPLIIIAYDNENWRIIADVSHEVFLKEAKTLTDAQLASIIQQRCQISFKIAESNWSSGFWIHERMINAYRNRRIFFAGDAAHVHSPAGGQGMNTGIQDAYNLAWKLALVISGHANKTLLDSYQAERYAVGKALLKHTDMLTRFMTLHHPILRAIRNIILKSVMHFDSNRRYFLNTMTQLNINYKKSPIVKNLMSRKKGPRAGYRMMDTEITFGKRLFDIVRGPKHSLLIFAGINSNFDLNASLSEFEKMMSPYQDLIKCIFIANPKRINELSQWNEVMIVDDDLKIHALYGANQACLYLIRPDKYIAFRSALDKKNEFREYLKSIFIV